ncbi:MAG: type II toxin-antitoxin system HicB family antitoxin [Alphaproteobacteria bacterium]|mgnify:CR=1 FL=1|jgi:antitoxin HicB|nr:type II toxin-antitoxin system HicB family antitoxin [Alphaproteobacteria bacterium]
MTQFHPYALDLEADPDGGFIVTCPQVPEVVTQGDTRAEAMANAPEALLAALQGYMRQKRPFPIPSKAPPEGTAQAVLPELAQAKALLHNAMLAERVSNSELARRMGKSSETQIRRILAPRVNVRFADLADALRATGRRLSLGVEGRPDIPDQDSAAVQALIARGAADTARV